MAHDNEHQRVGGGQKRAGGGHPPRRAQGQHHRRAVVQPGLKLGGVARIERIDGHGADALDDDGACNEVGDDPPPGLHKVGVAEGGRGVGYGGRKLQHEGDPHGEGCRLPCDTEGLVAELAFRERLTGALEQSGGRLEGRRGGDAAFGEAHVEVISAIHDPVWVPEGQDSQGGCRQVEQERQPVSQKKHSWRHGTREQRFAKRSQVRGRERCLSANVFFFS